MTSENKEVLSKFRKLHLTSTANDLQHNLGAGPLMQQWLALYNEHAATVGQVLTGLESQDVLIFFYLFGKKLFERQPTHSAHAICAGINSALTSPIPLVLPVEGISDHTCAESLDKLVQCGFVSRIKPKGKRKAVSEEGGRPPSFVYEARSVVEIIQYTVDEIELKKHKFLMIFNGLRQLEEEAGLR